MRAATMGLLLLFGAGSAVASPPISEAWRISPADTLSDSASVAMGRLASVAGFAATGGGVLLGVGLTFGGFASEGSDNAPGLGLTLTALSVVLGPAVGWSRAGYPGRALRGVLIRTAILGAAVGIVAYQARSDHGLDSIGAAVGVSLSGLAIATFEALAECSDIAPYVRARGPGGRAVTFAPAFSRSGAPGAALVLRLR